ncbi:uncharacterized protein LOC101243524 [Ciona intestinalis]
MLKDMLCCFGVRKRRNREKEKRKGELERAEEERRNMETKKKEKDEENIPASNDILADHVMSYLSKYIGYEWALLAFNLGLTRSDVAQIDRKYTGHKQKSYQMLLLWLKRHSGDSKRLWSLVSSLEICGRKDLAQKIHCAQWSEQDFNRLEMPQTFPMMVLINKVRPKSRALAFPPINDLNPTTCEPVHSLSPRFVQVM